MRIEGPARDSRFTWGDATGSSLEIDKGGWRMGIKAHVAAGLAACGLLLATGGAAATEFDTAMESILADYLVIQAALAADSTAGVAEAASEIQAKAERLDPGQAAGEHAAHYQNIPEDLLAACETLRSGQDIESIRSSFRELSKPISMWVTMAKPADTSVMYCPMKTAGWVQRGAEVSNPYFGTKMPSCGERVGGSDR